MLWWTPIIVGTRPIDFVERLSNYFDSGHTKSYLAYSETLIIFINFCNLFFRFLSVLNIVVGAGLRASRP